MLLLYSIIVFMFNIVLLYGMYVWGDCFKRNNVMGIVKTGGKWISGVCVIVGVLPVKWCRQVCGGGVYR